MSTTELLRLIGATGHHGFPVLDADDRLVGVVGWKEAHEVPFPKRDETLVSQIMLRDAPTLLPSESAGRALSLMERDQMSRIIVVDPVQRGKVLGIVTKANLIHTYADWIQSA